MNGHKAIYKDDSYSNKYYEDVDDFRVIYNNRQDIYNNQHLNTDQEFEDYYVHVEEVDQDDEGNDGEYGEEYGEEYDEEYDGEYGEEYGEEYEENMEEDIDYEEPYPEHLL